MIKQCEELWPDASDTRPRYWIAIARSDIFALLRFTLIDQEGDDYPKTLELTWSEWTQLYLSGTVHSLYGFNEDGSLIDGIVTTDPGEAWAE